MTIQSQIKELIQQALAKLELRVDEIHLEHPTDLSRGDYSTNVAMVLAKAAGKNPRELAEDIADGIDTNGFIPKVEVAGPGFINFSLSPDFFAQSITEILQNPHDYGKLSIMNGQKVLVEHSSPNLFKPFHIGHVMNNAIGESVARLFEYSGAAVTKISYPSDVSLGIGKAVWALLDNGIDRLTDTDVPLAEKLALLGDAYVRGTNAYDDPENQTVIRDITQKIYRQEPGPEWDAYLAGKDLSLEYFKSMTKRMGSEFDGYIFESEAGRVGAEIVQNHMGDVFTESNGAVVYEGEQDGLHTRVFINSEGNPTYESKDIGLLQLKFDTYQPDLSVFVTDHEQGPYFQVVQAAAGKIQKQWQDKTVHLVHGRMQFKGKKMSSRLGGVPLAEDILNIVSDEVVERAADRDLSEDTIDAIAIAALKYAILRSEAGKNINFDPDTSLSFEGDSGPYLQYTYARTQSIMRKAKEEGAMVATDLPPAWNITAVERLVYRFPEVIEQALGEYAPHYVATYLIELARAFNSLYGSTQILNPDDPSSGYKLALTESVGTVIKNGLWVLGIDSPEKM